MIGQLSSVVSAILRRLLPAAMAAFAASPAGANVLYNSSANAAGLAKVGGSSCPYFAGLPSNGCVSPSNANNMTPGAVLPTSITGIIDDESLLFQTGYSSYLVASADLIGRMKIFGPPNPLGGVSPANAIGPGRVSGETELNDTLTFSGPTAADGLYHFTINVHLDGLITEINGFEGTPNAPQLMGDSLVLSVFGATSCSARNDAFAQVGSPIDVTLSVACTTAGSAVYDTDLAIEMRNLYANLGSTASVYLDPLPPGVTVSSASGVFLNSPVPEPGTLSLVGTGFLGLAVAARRRERGRYT